MVIFVQYFQKILIKSGFSSQKFIREFVSKMHSLLVVYIIVTHETIFQINLNLLRNYSYDLYLTFSYISQSHLFTHKYKEKLQNEVQLNFIRDEKQTPVRCTKQNLIMIERDIPWRSFVREIAINVQFFILSCQFCVCQIVLSYYENVFLHFMLNDGKALLK